MFSNIILRYINKLVNNISGSRDIQYEFNLHITCNQKSLEKIEVELKQYFDSNKIEITNISINKDIIDSNLSYTFLVKKDNINVLDDLEQLLINNKIKIFSISKVSEIKVDEFDD